MRKKTLALFSLMLAFVMALSLLLTLTGGEIAGAEAVRKSYPEFFADLGRLGLRTEEL